MSQERDRIYEEIYNAIYKYKDHPEFFDILLDVESIACFGQLEVDYIKEYEERTKDVQSKDIKPTESPT